MAGDAVATAPTCRRVAIDRGTWLAALLSAVVVGCLWALRPAWSASATALLDGAHGGGGAAAMLGRALGKSASADRLRLVWAIIAMANAAGLVLLCRLAGGGRLAWLAAALVAAMSGDTLRVIGVEGPLLLMTITALLSGHLASRTPWLSAPMLSVALLGTALLSPIGLLAVPALAVIAALFPRPRSRPSDAAGLTSRPIAIPWFAGVVGALALLRVALPGDTALAWWNATIATLRAPTPPLLLGGLSEWKGIGGLLAGAALLPAVPLVVALSSLRSDAPRAQTSPSGGALFAAAAWWLVTSLTPETVTVDAVALISPLLVVSSLIATRRLLARAEVSGGRWLAIALAVALLIGGLADRASGGDPRSGLGRAIVGMTDPTALQPTVLRAEDLDILSSVDAPARIYPDRAGSRGLVAALRNLKVVGGAVREWDAFAAQYVLVHRPPVGPIAQGWQTSLPTVRCTRHACLLAMSDAQPAGPRPTNVPRNNAGPAPAEPPSIPTKIP